MLSKTATADLIANNFTQLQTAQNAKQAQTYLHRLQKEPSFEALISETDYPALASWIAKESTRAAKHTRHE